MGPARASPRWCRRADPTAAITTSAHAPLPGRSIARRSRPGISRECKLLCETANLDAVLRVPCRWVRPSARHHHLCGGLAPYRLVHGAVVVHPRRPRSVPDLRISPWLASSASLPGGAVRIGRLPSELIEMSNNGLSRHRTGSIPSAARFRHGGCTDRGSALSFLRPDGANVSESPCPHAFPG